MKKIPEFPEITNDMKQKYNYWAIDRNRVLWVYKDLPILGDCFWISSGRYGFEDSYEVIKLEGELKDWTKAVGYLCLDKPNNWDSLWVVEEPKHITLTNREVLTALLEGKEIQKAIIKEGENTPEWRKVTYLPFFATDNLDEWYQKTSIVEDHCTYRIKPETKTVRLFNGVELPDCITEPLHDGETYYLAGSCGVVELRWWGLTAHERLYIKNGCAYKNKVDAELHHTALTTYETIEKEII